MNPKWIKLKKSVPRHIIVKPMKIIFINLENMIEMREQNDSRLLM